GQSCVQAAGHRKTRLSPGIPAGTRNQWCWVGASGKSDQFDDSTAIQWEFENTGVLDDLADTRTAGFNESCVCLNLDLLRHLPHLQDRIDDRTAVDFQDNAGLSKCAESW